MDTNNPIPSGHDDGTRHMPTPAMPDHDDGLVHDHGWACSERGTKAHH